MTKKRVLLGVLAVWVLIVVVAAMSPDPEGPAQSAPTIATARPAPIEACFDSITGNVTELIALVMDDLNDPGSISDFDTQYERTPTTGTGGRHRVTMEYTAKNAYGGRVTQRAWALMHPTTCAVELLSPGF